MEDPTITTDKYFFTLYMHLICLSKWKSIMSLRLSRSVDSANKKQRNTIFANRSYNQWTIEGNQYNHTFILHSKFVLNYKFICFNCVHLFYNKFVSINLSWIMNTSINRDANVVANLQRRDIYNREKSKTDPLTFSFFHFSPLTFNFVISVL